MLEGFSQNGHHHLFQRIFLRIIALANIYFRHFSNMTFFDIIIIKKLYVFDVLKAWDYARTLFRSEKLQIAYIKAETCTRKHIDEYHGYVSWPCIMAMYHGYVSRLCITPIYHAYVSRLCIMAMYHGYVSWLCIMAMYHGYVSWLCIYYIILYILCIIKTIAANPKRLIFEKCFKLRFG